MKIDLIAIARQFGAGGSDLARALGDELKWPVLDREIIRGAAEELHTDEANAACFDEHVQGVVAKLARDFALSVPEYVVDPSYEVDPDDLARATHKVIRSAVANAPIIVVGHGVQCLFKTRPRTLVVRVVAPVDARAKRVAERLGMTEEAAHDEVKRRDGQRARYLRHHFGCDNNDPTLYDVQLNTARLTLTEVARAIGQLVREG